VSASNRSCFKVVIAAIIALLSALISCSDEDKNPVKPSGDTTAPTAITDLVVTGTEIGSTSLSWTAVGDDTTSGTACRYDLRYSTSMINFESAVQVAGVPSPQAAGTAESFTIEDLAPDKEYWFAIRVADESDNWSPISNTVSAITDSLFGEPIYYDVGVNPSSIVAVKLNADNHIDIAVSNRGEDNVTILLNNGDGTFLTSANPSVNREPRSLATADFDGDGDMDLATANGSTGDISVLLNLGNGTFETAVNYELSDPLHAYPASLNAVELNGDDDIDLVLADQYGSAKKISILFGNGDGSFQTPIDYDLEAMHVRTADLDGDMDTDLVASLCMDQAAILLNDGSGNFVVDSMLDLGFSGECATGLVLARFDGDQDFDIIVSTDECKVFSNNGDATFTTVTSRVIPILNNELGAYDLDDDGDLDLVGGFRQSQRLSIHMNTGAMAFTDRTDYWAEILNADDVGLVISDFDGDGHLDGAIATGDDGKLAVFLAVW